MINHHRDDLLFRGNSAIPLNPAALNWIFQPRFRHVDVASLIPLIWSRFGSGNYSKVTSTLVNVCSPFSGFSTGFNEAPPALACPLGSHILFTFAVKYDTDFDLNSLQFNTTGIRSRIWGSGNYPRKFITIGISSVEATNLGLLHVQQNECNYLYRLVGILFRSFFLHYTAGEIAELKRGQDVKPTVDQVYAYRDKYLHLPLSSIVRHPFWAWQYNLKIWEKSPNMIAHVGVSPVLALYYFLFLSQKINPNVRTEDGLARLLGVVPGEIGGIRQVVRQSLMSFTQYLNNPSDYQFELIDLLAANVLASLVYSGRSKLVLNKSHYVDDLESNAVAFAEQLGRHLSKSELALVLTPYDDVARSILVEDPTLSIKLLSGIQDKS